MSNQKKNNEYKVRWISAVQSAMLPLDLFHHLRSSFPKVEYHSILASLIEACPINPPDPINPLRLPRGIDTTQGGSNEVPPPPPNQAQRFPFPPPPNEATQPSLVDEVIETPAATRRPQGFAAFHTAGSYSVSTLGNSDMSPEDQPRIATRHSVASGQDNGDPDSDDELTEDKN